MKSMPRISLTCETCGSVFHRLECQIKREGRGRFCSKECMWEWRRNGNTYTCLECGKEFYRRDGESVKNNPTSDTFCSKPCYFAHRRRNMKRTTYKKIGTRHAHRVIAERIIGRPLRRSEVVHHINGDTHDNSPDNLMVLANQAEHARIHFSNDIDTPAQTL